MTRDGAAIDSGIIKTRNNKSQWNPPIRLKRQVGILKSIVKKEGGGRRWEEGGRKVGGRWEEGGMKVE